MTTWVRIRVRVIALAIMDVLSIASWIPSALIPMNNVGRGVQAHAKRY